MATDIRQLLPTTVRAALLAGSAPSALNPYITASALSSFGFVPYTGATASLDMGANNIVTGQLTDDVQAFLDERSDILINPVIVGNILEFENTEGIKGYAVMTETPEDFEN